MLGLLSLTAPVQARTSAYPATTQPQNRMPSWDRVYSLLEVVSGDASLCSFGLAVSSLLTMLRHVLPT